MAFKDTLLVLTSYPDQTPPGSIAHATAIGALLGTSLSAISFEIDVEVPGGSNILADRLLKLPSILATERQKSLANATELLDAFEKSAKQHGIFQERILERSLTSMIAEVLVDHARLHDLTIIPLRDGDSIEHWYAESVVFGSGRPTLVLPDPARFRREPALNTIAIAWDFSRPAARVVADALPILQKARSVRAVTVSHEKKITTRRSADQLIHHLALHGISAGVDVVDSQDRPIGDVLSDYVISNNVDMLAMGAYGHSRLRDFVLGGATKSMLAQPPVPLFLSH